MAVKTLAIDPATKKLGLALFLDTKLVYTETLEAKAGDRLQRAASLIDQLAEVLWFRSPDIIVVEDPLLQGKANNAIQRIIGSIEALSEAVNYWQKERSIAEPGLYNYIPPMTVKKYMGSGSLDKLEVAMAAAKFLDQSGQDRVAELILQEAWDETDAVAIGLTWFLQRGVIKHDE